jgi:hypothetical protein
MHPGDELRIGALEGAGIEQQAAGHDVHREEAADAEADQQPGGLRLLAAAVADLERQAAAIAAEGMRYAVDRPLHRPRADRQQAMAAERAVGGDRRSHCGIS